jgi:hypothetical protein
MAVHKHTSWGRTRGPKNLNGKNGANVTVLAHDAVPVTTGISTGTGARDGTTGYATENQRFLFVNVVATDQGTPGRDIEVWWYFHASGTWSFKEAIDCDSQTADSSKVYEITINGADRVAFVRDAGAWAADNRAPTVYAACSTF